MFMNRVLDEGRKPGILGTLDFVLYKLETASRSVRRGVFFVRLIPLGVFSLLLAWISVWLVLKFFFSDVVTAFPPPMFEGEYWLLGVFAVYLLLEVFVLYRDSCCTVGWDGPIFLSDVCHSAPESISYFALCLCVLAILLGLEREYLYLMAFFVVCAFCASRKVLYWSHLPHHYHYSDYGDIAFRKGYTTFQSALLDSVCGKN